MLNIPTLEQKAAWLKPVPATEYELACAAKIDPADYEIGFQRTNDILDEGMDVFARSCRGEMGVAGDAVITIMSAQGDMVNCSSGTYLHTVITPLIIKYILETYQVNPGIKDGDLWFANDAVFGGIHNPDQMVAMPVFKEGQLIAWVAALTHTTETGAIEPGGMPVSAKSRFEEGMNLPPMKIGENFELREDILNMFLAFGLRAPQYIAVDLKARCTTADRVRRRLLEFCDREGEDYLLGLFRKMLITAEESARKRIRSWPDGTFRCVTFGDAVGSQPGLFKNCFMTLTKEGDHITVDLTGTGAETASSYNAHPQVTIGHFTNYVFEYAFHDLPMSNATFASHDFIFEKGSCLYPDARAATSNSVMVMPGVMSAVHNCYAKMMFASQDWKQAGAAQAGGNGYALAGVSQWGVPYVDLCAYTINTEGQGALPTHDGMDAYGFPWCAFGRAPNIESMENDIPLLVTSTGHWRDSCGHGKYRGGVGTLGVWVAHQAPSVTITAVSDNSKLQTPQPLFGGYGPSTVPGISMCNVDVVAKMKQGDPDLVLNGNDMLERQDFGGEWKNEMQGRSPRAYSEGEVLTIAFATGGSGYGDPLDRDPADVGKDIQGGLITLWTANHVYCVEWNEKLQKVDIDATNERRAGRRAQRLSRGQPYAAFEQEWLQKRPAQDILTHYGTWPDAKAITPIMRP